MYFVRSGVINLNQGSLQRASYLALYWFATALPNNSTSAYNNYIDHNIVYPDNTDYYNRRIGYSLHSISSLLSLVFRP